MSDLTVISSSDEDDDASSYNIKLKLPTRTKSFLKPVPSSFLSSSKTILYTEKTIDQHIEDLFSSANACKLKQNESLVELNNLFDATECFVYCRINEILCMEIGDKSHLRKVKVLGVYINNGENYKLFDTMYSMKLYLHFSLKDSMPIDSSNVIVFGYLNLSKESKPIIHVCSWEYVNETLMIKYDNSLYSQRLYIQNINENLSSKIDSECDIAMDSFDDYFIKQIQQDDCYNGS